MIPPNIRKSMSKQEIHLSVRRSKIFQTEGSESNFLDLSSPRSGRLIKWKMGELVGEGAYAKVYQCMNLRTGELMAVKHFVVFLT